jgi:hypothetical protein
MNPQQLSRTLEARRLAETKLATVEESLDRLRRQQEWLRRYNEVQLTLGPADNQASQVASGFGCKVQACGPTDVCVDTEHKVLTTPAYMAATHISEIFDGAANLVAALARMWA